MSANLDKSLDEIISAKPRAGRRGSRNGGAAAKKPAGTRVGKASAAAPAKKAAAKKAAAASAPASKVNPIEEASKLADRIIISNLVCNNYNKHLIRT